MDYQVVLTAKARTDLRGIAAYIARDDPAAALRFSQQLLDDALALRLSPQRGVQVRQRPGVRRIILRSYLIYYRVEEDRSIVRVLRFWHGASDPKTLRFGG